MKYTHNIYDQKGWGQIHFIKYKYKYIFLKELNTNTKYKY